MKESTFATRGSRSRGWVENAVRMVAAVHVLHNCIAGMYMLSRDAERLRYLRNNKFRNFYLIVFAWGLLAVGACIILSLLKLFFQVAFAAAFHLRLVPVLAKVFGYVILVHFVPAYYCHLHHTLKCKAEHDQYGYCGTHAGANLRKNDQRIRRSSSPEPLGTVLKTKKPR